MPDAKTKLVGGHFQDATGNLLALGKLVFKLSQDAVTTDALNFISGGIEVEIKLDGNGDVFGTQTLDTPKQYMWANDVLLPDVTYYTVTAYTAEGQTAWANPQVQVVANGSSFDLGTWIPNAVVPPQLPGVQGVTIEVDDVIAIDQAILNLKSGKNVTITDDIHGGKTFAAAGPGDFASNVFVTATLAPGGQERGTWIIGKAFELSKCSVNIPARVRMYTTTAARDADKDRPNYISPTPGLRNDILCDLYLTGVGTIYLDWRLDPVAMFLDVNNVPTGVVAYTVDNISGMGGSSLVTGAVTVALTYFKKG